MDDVLVSDLPDLTDVTIADLFGPSPELRAALEACADRVRREVDRPRGDGRCC
jgi:hypothetical protein